MIMKIKNDIWRENEETRKRGNGRYKAKRVKEGNKDKVLWNNSVASAVSRAKFREFYFRRKYTGYIVKASIP